MNRSTTIIVSLAVAFAVTLATSIVSGTLLGAIFLTIPEEFWPEAHTLGSPVGVMMFYLKFSLAFGLVALCVGVATLARHGFAAQQHYGRDYLRAWAITISGGVILISLWSLTIDGYFQSEFSRVLEQDEGLHLLGLFPVLYLIGNLVVVCGIVGRRFDRLRSAPSGL